MISIIMKCSNLLKSFYLYKCTNCMRIVPASVVASGREANSYLNQVFVMCSHCNCEFLTSQRTMRGDPRNQAIVIHEDSFLIFDGLL